MFKNLLCASVKNSWVLLKVLIHKIFWTISFMMWWYFSIDYHLISLPLMSYYFILLLYSNNLCNANRTGISALILFGEELNWWSVNSGIHISFEIKESDLWLTGKMQMSLEESIWILLWIFPSPNRCRIGYFCPLVLLIAMMIIDAVCSS